MIDAKAILNMAVASVATCGSAVYYLGLLLLVAIITLVVVQHKVHFKMSEKMVR